MSGVRVYKRGDKWAYRFEAAPIGGKRQQPSKGGFDTKKEAKIAGAKAYNDYLNAGKAFKPSEMSYADLLDEWLTVHCPLIYDDTTLANYEKTVNLHIKPLIGKYRLNSLDTVDFQQVINKKFEDGYAYNRISTFKNVMSLSMKYARRMNYIQYNPMYEATLPTKKAVKNNKATRSKPRTVVPKDVIQKIFERFPEGSTAHLPLMIAYKAGLRIAEVFALSWDDIDLEAGYIHVNRQIQNRGKNGGNKWYVKGCKYDSERSLPIDSDLVSLLRRERRVQLENRLFYGPLYVQYYIDKDDNVSMTNGTPINFIMRNENGELIKSRIMQHTSSVIHGTANNGCEPIWPKFDFHSLRHTHGTELAEAGVSAKEIQVRLGHKNIETTLNLYVHETPALVERTRDTLEEMYKKAK